MSKFSEYLKSLIEASDETIASIARNIHCERTSIHKALKGERILPIHTACALAVYFQLTPEEREEYFRLYGMQLQGEDLWRNREAVCEILNQLSAIQFDTSTANKETEISREFNPSFEYKLIEGEYSVQNTISSILSLEINQNPETHFRVFLPFGVNLASILLKLWGNGSHFTTDHLFCFPSGNSSDCSESVKVLKQIIPLCLTARDFYHPYYFYERPGAMSANPLSHYIITAHYLILLSDDLSMALIHSSEHLISYYTNHFNGLMDYCEPFVSISGSLPEILNRASAMVDTKGCLYIMPQPCFGFSTTPQMIDKYFKAKDFPEEVYASILNHFSVLKTSKNFNTVFSEKGLKTFVETGEILEYPSSFVSNLTVQDRITFLTQLRDNIESGRVTGRIARPSALNIPDYLTVYIDTGGHVWFDTTRDFAHDAYYCNIHITERSICRALMDFSKSLVGSQMLYTQEETLNILDESINELKKMC